VNSNCTVVYQKIPLGLPIPELGLHPVISDSKEITSSERWTVRGTPVARQQPPRERTRFTLFVHLTGSWNVKLHTVQYSSNAQCKCFPFLFKMERSKCLVLLVLLSANAVIGDDIEDAADDPSHYPDLEHLLSEISVSHGHSLVNSSACAKDIEKRCDFHDGYHPNDLDVLECFQDLRVISQLLKKKSKRKKYTCLRTLVLVHACERNLITLKLYFHFALRQLFRDMLAYMTGLCEYM
jgi:hypothetical protein